MLGILSCESFHFAFIYLICVFVHVCAVVCLERSYLSVYHISIMSPGDSTQDIMLGTRHPH